MKKVNFLSLRSKLPFLLLVFLLTFSTTIYSQDDSGEQAAAEEAASVDSGADIAAGESLFKMNCAACHKMDSKSIGPALRGVGDKFEREWLYKWIQNSQGLIASGDALAIKLFEENNKMVMTPFPGLSETDMDNILAYTDQPKPEPKVATTAAASDASSSDGGISNEIVLGALALIFLLLAVMLFLVFSTLKRIAEAKGVPLYPEGKEKRTPLWKAFVQNQFLVIVTSVVLLLGGSYFAFGFLMQVGVD